MLSETKILASFIEHVHPLKGVRFLLHLRFLADDLVLNKEELAPFSQTKLFTAGEIMMAQENRILLTKAEYYQQFVYPCRLSARSTR